MSRTPLRNEPPLLDVERAIRLAQDAAALRRRPPREDEDAALGRLAAKLPLDAALLALETAVDTGDPRVLAAALELAIERVRWDDDPIDYEVGSIAGSIVEAVPAIDNRVRECARSKSASLRAFTAKGLGPRALRSLRGEGDEVDAEAAAIVFALTKDAHRWVRKSARDALGGAAPPAWAAFFARDPLASRPAAEAAALRGPLDRAAEALEKGVRKDPTPLVEAIAALPDELAAPILEAWIRTPYAALAEEAAPLLDRWLALDPDGARLAAWLREMEHSDAGLHAASTVGAALGRRPDALAACMRLAHLCLELGDQRLPRITMVTDVLEAAWPDDADPTPLLELGLGVSLDAAATADAIDPAERREVAERLLRRIALAPRTSFEALVEPLADALVAGFPGRWQAEQHTLYERLVGARHPTLRAHAEASLRGDDERAIAWALRHLAAGGHDPDRDPPPEVMLREAARDPRLRAVIAKTPQLAASGALRARFEELSPQETIALASSLLTAEEELEPAEWAAVRRAREGLAHPSFGAQALPGPGAFTDEDAAFIEGLLEEQGERPPVIGHLLISLARGAAPELIAIVERFVDRMPAPFDAMVRSAIVLSRGKSR